MTDRGKARHRASTRATTPLTVITSSVGTGLQQAVGDGVEILGRGGAAIVVSTGLVAATTLTATTLPDRLGGQDPQTANLTLDPAAAQLAAFGSTVADGGPVSDRQSATPVSRGGPLTEPKGASSVLDNGSLTRASAQAAERASRSALLSRARTVAAVAADPVAGPAAKTAATPARTTKKTTARTSTKTTEASTRSSSGSSAAAPVRTSTRKTAAPTKAPVKAPVKAAPAAPAARGSSVLAIAARYVGIPYRYGGTTPAGFDCSGFTQYVYKQIGVSLPRTAQSQMNAATRISRSQAKPGDLVFVVGGGTTGHVGIYAGGNMMYDSPRSGKSLSKRSIWTSSVVFGRVS